MPTPDRMKGKASCWFFALLLYLVHFIIPIKGNSDVTSVLQDIFSMLMPYIGDRNGDWRFICHPETYQMSTFKHFWWLHLTRHLWIYLLSADPSHLCAFKFWGPV